MHVGLDMKTADKIRHTAYKIRIHVADAAGDCCCLAHVVCYNLPTLLAHVLPHTQQSVTHTCQHQLTGLRGHGQGQARAMHLGLLHNSTLACEGPGSGGSSTAAGSVLHILLEHCLLDSSIGRPAADDAAACCVCDAEAGCDLQAE